MKTVLVTGASGNMGKAIVNKFLDEGHFVIGTFIPNEAQELRHERFQPVIIDLFNANDAENLVRSIVEKYQSLDTVVLTVGGFAQGTIDQTSTEDVGRQVRLNFDTTYNVARPAFIQMKKQKHGRIFMTGSRPGLHSLHGKGLVAYSLGKSLLFRLADLMNEEAKGMDVVTSVVVPSTIDTPQNRKAMPQANFSDWVQPSEIADIIFYHSREESKALRETIIKVYNNS